MRVKIHQSFKMEFKLYTENVVIVTDQKQPLIKPKNNWHYRQKNCFNHYKLYSVDWMTFAGLDIKLLGFVRFL